MWFPRRRPPRRRSGALATYTGTWLVARPVAELAVAVVAPHSVEPVRQRPRTCGSAPPPGSPRRRRASVTAPASSGSSSSRRRAGRSRCSPSTCRAVREAARTRGLARRHGHGVREARSPDAAVRATSSFRRRAARIVSAPALHRPPLDQRACVALARVTPSRSSRRSTTAGW